MAAEAYAMLKDESVLSLIDTVIQLLSEWSSPAEPYLSEFALRLATRSRDRGPVKAGIALLGAMRLAKHEAVVTALGMHRFTSTSARYRPSCTSLVRRGQGQKLGRPVAIHTEAPPE